MANVLVENSSLQAIATAIRTKNGSSDTYKPSEMSGAILAIPTGGVTPTGTKSITANGTNIDVAQYAYADVAVPNSYAASDEGKVVSNGTLVAQTAHAEVTSNGTIDTTLNNSVTVNVSGGGGGDITVESKSITANGEYTAPTGKAYSPVTVNVPNSYTAGDEGKVVSNGALVAQTAHAEVTENGTIDTTLNNSVVVNVSGGGVARTAGTLTFETRTAWAGYTLDVGIDAAQFAIYATTDPLQSNGRTFQGFFVDLATSYAKGGLWVSSNSAGSASSGSFIANSSNVSKSGTVLTFQGGSSAYFQAGITYQWYAWGAAT